MMTSVPFQRETYSGVSPGSVFQIAPRRAVSSRVFLHFSMATHPTQKRWGLSSRVKTLSDQSRTHFIIIDGLDECQQPDRELVIRALKELLDLRKPQVKVFISA